MQNNKGNNERKAKNSEARIRANNKYTNANYQNINIKIRPDQAEAIRETAKQFNISIAQLIINSVNEYKTNHGADPEQQEQPEEETENEIETEGTAGRKTQSAGAEEEPQEDEDEDEKPEEIPAFVWEQIQRLKKADKRHTAERKAREAAERKRRRIGESGEDY